MYSGTGDPGLPRTKTRALDKVSEAILPDLREVYGAGFR
jgi:hypothetical protein